MNYDLLFKNINGKIHIIVNDQYNFNKFIEVLKNRLEKLYIKDDLLKANVILDVHNISLDTKQILTIFDVLSNFENLFLDKIIYKENIEKNIVLHEGNIRGGEIRLFTTNTLLIGNVNKGAKVIVNGNLYVIGKVSGIVEFKNISNKLYASSIDNCFVKICSIEKQFNETLENSLISLVDNKIIEEKFMDRRERIHGKSNCSYIW